MLNYYARNCTGICTSEFQTAASDEVGNDCKQWIQELYCHGECEVKCIIL